MKVNKYINNIVIKEYSQCVVICTGILRRHSQCVVICTGVVLEYSQCVVICTGIYPTSYPTSYLNYNLLCS